MYYSHIRLSNLRLLLAQPIWSFVLFSYTMLYNIQGLQTGCNHHAIFSFHGFCFSSYLSYCLQLIFARDENSFSTDIIPVSAKLKCYLLFSTAPTLCELDWEQETSGLVVRSFYHIINCEFESQSKIYLIVNTQGINEN